MILSICTGMGLLDRAFLNEGLELIPGCEIDPDQRLLYNQLCGADPVWDDIKQMIEWLKQNNLKYAGVIGSPPCQAFTKLKSRRLPKFPDLTPEVNEVLELTQPKWYLFENVVPINIPGARHVLLDAMHFAKPHQSRPRWFTYSPNLKPPKPVFSGSVDELIAYAGVYGKLYGPKRGGGYFRVIRKQQN